MQTPVVYYDPDGKFGLPVVIGIAAVVTGIIVAVNKFNDFLVSSENMQEKTANWAKEMEAAAKGKSSSEAISKAYKERSEAFREQLKDAAELGKEATGAIYGNPPLSNPIDVIKNIYDINKGINEMLEDENKVDPKNCP